MPHTYAEKEKISSNATCFVWDILHTRKLRGQNKKNSREQYWELILKISWPLTIICASGAHLSVTSSIRSLTGWPGPVAVVGMPVGVIVTVMTVAFLVHRTVMMVMVMVVTTVLGPATIPLTLFGWQVPWLCGGAEVCAKAWQGDVSVYICKHKTNNLICLLLQDTVVN